MSRAAKSRVKGKFDAAALPVGSVSGSCLTKIHAGPAWPQSLTVRYPAAWAVKGRAGASSWSLEEVAGWLGTQDDPVGVSACSCSIPAPVRIRGTE